MGYIQNIYNCVCDTIQLLVSLSLMIYSWLHLLHVYKCVCIIPCNCQTQIAMASKILLVCSYLILSLCFGGARAQGLSRNYYDVSCPDLASIVRTQLKKVFKNDIGQAAGLLRLHFHDCFVQVSKFKRTIVDPCLKKKVNFASQNLIFKQNYNLARAFVKILASALCILFYVWE